MNFMVSDIMESKILKIEQSCIDVWVEKTDEKVMSRFQDDVHPIAWQLMFSQFSQKFPCNNCVSHCIIEFSTNITIFITITTITIFFIKKTFLENISRKIQKLTLQFGCSNPIQISVLSRFSVFGLGFVPCWLVSTSSKGLLKLF